MCNIQIHKEVAGNEDEQVIKLLIDEYWKSSERHDEAELIATFEQEK